MRDSLEFVPLAPRHQAGLAAFFAELRATRDDRFFHPHPFTAEKAAELASYAGQDLYYVAALGDRIVGYGMLRGWEAGFAIPSLGIALSPDVRGTGLANAFMIFLHTAARLRGADQIRLKVYADNTPARRLYEKLGYQFEASEGDQLVGKLSLRPLAA